MNIDAINALIITTLTICSVFLIVVGYYLVRLLREMQEVTERANRISRKTERVVTFVEESVNGAQDITQGIGYIAGFFKRITGMKRSNEK